MPAQRIPPSVIGAAAPILAEAYTHAQLDSLFMMAGFPGDPPEGSKVMKCQAWLRLANRDCDDALDIFGRLVAEFMDTEPATRGTFWSPPAEPGEDRRAPLRDAFEREGLSYQRGGYLIGGALRGPSKSLAERLTKDGSRALETEYQRAYSQVESDPPAAVTAACAILETVCKTYLESEGHPLPSKQVLGSLWSETSNHLGLSPKDVADLDLKRILSGLSSIADGVAALRTHKGSAHGHADISVEGKTYRLAPRHARLAVHAAHTMALFVLETWEARRKPTGS
ncbi:abortive infection family protein [Brevundimonas sp. M1A4_2e]